MVLNRARYFCGFLIQHIVGNTFLTENYGSMVGKSVSDTLELFMDQIGPTHRHT
jgi:hypothetical protein